jgi:antitoxin VapB
MYIFKVYTLTGEGDLMKTAKIFKSGNSQAVRLPKELQFDVSEVEIFRRGDEIVLRKKPQNLARVFELLADMSEDFMENGRHQPSVQEREPF